GVIATTTPLPAASPSALTTIGAPLARTSASASATLLKRPYAPVGMPNSVQSALVNPLEPSSSAACLLGPNALMPTFARSSTMPAASGVSGPTTTSSTALRLQKSTTAAWSAMSSTTHSA